MKPDYVKPIFDQHSSRPFTVLAFEENYNLILPSCRSWTSKFNNGTPSCVFLSVLDTFHM